MWARKTRCGRDSRWRFSAYHQKKKYYAKILSTFRQTKEREKISIFSFSFCHRKNSTKRPDLVFFRHTGLKWWQNIKARHQFPFFLRFAGFSSNIFAQKEKELHRSVVSMFSDCHISFDYMQNQHIVAWFNSRSHTQVQISGTLKSFPFFAYEYCFFDFVYVIWRRFLFIEATRELKNSIQ